MFGFCYYNSGQCQFSSAPVLLCAQHGEEAAGEFFSCSPEGQLLLVAHCVVSASRVRWGVCERPRQFSAPISRRPGGWTLSACLPLLLMPVVGLEREFLPHPRRRSLGRDASPRSCPPPSPRPTGRGLRLPFPAPGGSLKVSDAPPPTA